MTEATPTHDALVNALEECTARFRKSLIANGTSDEYANIAVEVYRNLIAAAREIAP